jgi:hypothetical protein
MTLKLPPFYFDADADPDPAFHFDADANPDPDPASQNDADPCGPGSATLPEITRRNGVVSPRKNMQGLR